MVQRHDNSNKIIYIADRGYESYNVMAHIYNQNQFFLIRIKDFNIGGIAQMFPKPTQDEFDQSVTRVFTRHSHKNIVRNMAIIFVLDTSMILIFLHLSMICTK